MPRPNKGTDRVLIETGKKMLLKNGINGLTISAICKKARVNPGMFVYNFKSKEEYLDRVLNEIFEEYLIPLVPEPATDSVYDNMEHVLFFIAKASAKYPALMIQVGSETLTGDKTLIHAFKERVAKKTRGIFPLFKKAKEAIKKEASELKDAISESEEEQSEEYKLKDDVNTPQV